MNPESTLASMELKFLRLRIRFACHEMNNYITQISGQVTLARMALGRGEDVSERMDRLGEVTKDITAAVRGLHQSAAVDAQAAAGESLLAIRDEARSLIRSGRQVRDVISIDQGVEGTWAKSCAMSTRTLLLAVYLASEALLSEADDDAAVLFALSDEDALAWSMTAAIGCDRSSDSMPRLALRELSQRESFRIKETESESEGSSIVICLS